MKTIYVSTGNPENGEVELEELAEKDEADFCPECGKEESRCVCLAEADEEYRKEKGESDAAV